MEATPAGALTAAPGCRGPEPRKMPEGASTPDFTRRRGPALAARQVPWLRGELEEQKAARKQTGLGLSVASGKQGQ